MKPEQSRRVRGWILQFLAQAPMGDGGERYSMDSDFLVSQLRGTGQKVVREEVERELGYLASKKYVELGKMKGAAYRILDGALTARITAAGQDVIDGSVADDPGVDLGAFRS